MATSKTLVDFNLDNSQVAYRYLHFLLNHNNLHWTLLVFHTRERTWWHYNTLLLPKETEHDKCLDTALLLKKYVEKYEQGRAAVGEAISATHDNAGAIISVRPCPQQKSGS